MNKINRFCVFCGSSLGSRPEYADAAVELGQVLLRREIGLVYGGASVGLMGKLAETILDGNGDVIGVIPSGLAEMEVADERLSNLRVVDSMHERKALMADLADAFIAMPGGLGTIEEIFEAITWAQLGIHEKPCGFLNIGGYYNHIINFLEGAVEEAFIRADHRSMVLVDTKSESLLEQFDRYKPPKIDKVNWVLSLKNM
ncbi:MAG: TIGR00730 family Rossman fold protein [Cyanobacteria bacterium P01_H01_bin.15]